MKGKWMKSAKRTVLLMLSFAMTISMFAVLPAVETQAVTAGQLREGANYVIVSKQSGKALTVENYTDANNAKIVQMSVNNYESQVWTLDYDDNGYYSIVNYFSGKALDIPGGSDKAGEEIIQFNNWKNDNQKWKITDVGGGYCRISPKVQESYALDVYGASNEDGAPLIQWPYSGASNELWEIREVSSINKNPGNKIRVTCVGDSITDGYLASDSAHTYPAQMQQIIGDEYQVLNVGVSGSMVINSHSSAYTKTSNYTRGLQSKPDIVIIMIGTNDAVTNGMDTQARQDEFRRDYASLIEAYQKCGSNPKIILGLPLTSVNESNQEDDRDYRNENYTIPIIKDLAKQYNLQLIDAHTYTGTWTREYLGDGLHPNDAGYEKLARLYGNAVVGYTKGFTADLQENTGYMLVSKASGQAITPDNYSSDSGVGIEQMKAVGYKEQTWKLVPTEDGYYIIVNANNGKVLDVPGFSNQEGTQIIQYGQNNGDNQKWKIEATGTGHWRISPKLAGNQALNVYGYSYSEGAAIIQWPYSGANNELWEIRKVN